MREAKLLASRRRHLLAAALNKTRNPGTSSALQDLQEVQGIDHVLKAMPSSVVPDGVVSIGVAMGCVLAMVLLLNLRISSVTTDFQVASDAIEVVTEPTTFPSLKVTGLLVIQGVTKADLRGLGVVDGIAGAQSTIVVDSPPGTWSNVAMTAPPGRITIKETCSSDGKRQLLLNAAVPLQLDVVVPEGAGIRSDSRAVPVDVTARETGASFAVFSAPGLGLTVRGERSAFDFGFVGTISEINFTRDSSSDFRAKPFSSGILSGEISIHEAQALYEVQPGAWLALGGLAGVAAISSNEKCAAVMFSGKVQKISMGSAVASEDLAPTWLAYAFQERGLPFYSTVFGVFWGAIWGGLSWVRKRSA